MLQPQVTTCEYLPVITSITIMWTLAYWSKILKIRFWLEDEDQRFWHELGDCLWCCSFGSQFGKAGYKTVINWCQVLSVPVRDLVGWRRITWWAWSNHRVSSFRRGERGQTHNSVFLVNIGIQAELRNNNVGQDNTYRHMIVNFKIHVKTIIEYW